MRNQPWYPRRLFGCNGLVDVEDSAMSLKLQVDFSVSDETRRVAQAAFPKGCACLRITDALGCLYQDKQFAALFPRRGRPGGDIPYVCRSRGTNQAFRNVGSVVYRMVPSLSALFWLGSEIASWIPCPRREVSFDWSSLNKVGACNPMLLLDSLIDCSRACPLS